MNLLLIIYFVIGKSEIRLHTTLDPEYQSLFLDNNNLIDLNDVASQSKNYNDKISLIFCF